MYESVTKYLSAIEAGEPFLKSNKFQEVDEDGNISILGYTYVGWAKELMAYVADNPVDYFAVLEDRGIDPDGDVSNLPLEGDPKLAYALLTWAVRGEKFCDGCYAGSIENGLVERCLQSLLKADND